MLSTPSTTMTRRRALIVLLLTGLHVAGHADAYTAVAVVNGHSTQTMYVAANHETQNEADAYAVAGCQARAREEELADRAAHCAVADRPDQGGAGALVCGDTGCAWSTGAANELQALALALKNCDSAGYGNCQPGGKSHWFDDDTASQPRAVNVTGTNPRLLAACSRAPARNARYTTHCDDGACARTFENGCKVQFTAPYCQDAASGKWAWKADGCG
jgi:hypothetical protein